MTPEEKQEIINAVISQLLSSGCDITGLNAAQSLDGISTFPAVLTTTNNGVTTKALVSVPISLLTQAVQDVITNANTAATSARSAAAGWAAAAVKMGSDIVVIEGNISNLQDADKSISTLTAYAECSTAANVSAKAVTVQHFALPTSGGCLHIKMEHANTAVSSVTLNINATGAKDLLYNGSVVSATNTWQDNEVLEIYYDGENYQATNAQGGGGSAEPSYVVPTWSGYVGASNATTIEDVNLDLNNLTHYSNASGSVSVQISSTSYLWFAVNREVRIESFGIEVPVQYMGMDNDLYYYKTYEEILPSTIGVELIATDASQGDDSGGGDTPTPTPTAQKPTIVTPPQSANYNEGATPNALTVVASVSDGGTLSFQWYKDNSPFGSADSGTVVSNGVQSSITPASVTATYYCVITNTKSGANSNTNQTTSVTVTFNEESGSEMTHEEYLNYLEQTLGFSIGKRLSDTSNSSTLVDDDAYCVTDWFTVNENSTKVCFYNMISNRGSGITYTWQVKSGNTYTSYKYSNGGRKITMSNGQQFRVVLNKDEVEYCFIYIGSNLAFKGSKVPSLFLQSMGEPSTYFGTAYSVNETSPYPISLINNPSGDPGSTTLSDTWITKGLSIISGHTYRIWTGWANSTKPPYKIVCSRNELQSNNDEGNAFDWSSAGAANGYIQKTFGSNGYLYCNFSLKVLHTCYVFDATDNIYIIKGGKVS